MTSKDFTTKRHVSCNGCFFQKTNLATCTQKENNNLLFDLWKTFGTCLKKEIIFILKTK